MDKDAYPYMKISIRESNSWILYRQELCSVEHNRKNWEMIETINGAKTSAIIYSIAETAKANNLKPYDYFEYLLTEIPNHMEETDRSFLKDLLPWSPNLPEHIIRKPK